MATAPTSPPPTKLIVGLTIGKAFKVLFWGVLIYFGLQFFIRSAVPYFTIAEEAYGPFWPRWGWLLTHITGGTFALFMGPFQFWSGFRQRYLRIHRWTGRLYLGGVLLGSSTAFYIVFFTPFGFAYGVGLFTMGVAWITTSVMAFIAIQNRQIAAHKEWMIRSYVVTFGFVTFRLLGDLPFISDLPLIERFPMQSWACWAIPLFVTEVILQWKHIRQANVR